jgi:hypothetical protein
MVPIDHDEPNIGDYVRCYIQKPGPSHEKICGLVISTRPTTYAEADALSASYWKPRLEIEMMICILKENGELLWIDPHAVEIISRS